LPIFGTWIGTGAAYPYAKLECHFSFLDAKDFWKRSLGIAPALKGSDKWRVMSDE